MRFHHTSSYFSVSHEPQFSSSSSSCFVQLLKYPTLITNRVIMDVLIVSTFAISDYDSSLFVWLSIEPGDNYVHKMMFSLGICRPN